MNTLLKISLPALLAFSAVASAQSGGDARAYPQVDALALEQQQAIQSSAAFFCEAGSGQYLCQAQDFSPPATTVYSWSTSGALVLPYGCYDQSSCVVNCWGNTGGTVTLTATNTATGFSSSRQRHLQCGAGAWSPY